MKQKFSMVRDSENNQLILREYAELDKDSLSLLCEEKYDLAEMEALQAEGTEAVKAALKTRNFYPPSNYLEQIIASMAPMFQEKDAAETAEVFVDDMQYFEEAAQEAEEAAAAESEDSDIDELLDDDEDIEDEFSEDDIPSLGANPSLKIADDDSLDIDEDS